MQKTSKKQKILVLLDAHAILHRAYHALPSFTSPDGKPTGALYGFSAMLLKIIRELKPDHIAACYDMAAPTFRHIVYKEYKGTRAKTDDELISQFDVSRDILRAFGIPVYEKESFEADDIIGTIVAKTKQNKNISVIIASGDLDTLQLVDGKKAQVYTLRKGVQDTLLYDEDAVKKRFGFGPEFLPDFKGLKGDPSDNIRGVPGIGDKTASALIRAFGTLENILLLAKKHTEKLQQAGIKERIIGLLQQHAEAALFSKELACIRKDAPISFSLNDAAWRDGIKEEAVYMFRQLGFTSLLSRMGEDAPSDVSPHNKKKMYSPTDNYFWKNLDAAKKRYWVLHEHTLCIVTEKKEIYTCPVSDIVSYADKFKKITSGTNHAFSVKQVLHVFSGCTIDFLFKDDLHILFWLADPRRTDSSPKNMLRALFPSQVRDMPDMYALLPDAHEILLKDVREKKLKKIYKEIELPFIRPLFSMERAGILIDTNILTVLAKEIKQKLDGHEKKIHALAGESFNINSPKELSRVLFEALEISTKGIKKTGTGQRSTRFSELAKLKGAHPIIEHIILYRELGKLSSTYVSVLPTLVQKDGRIHTTFHQTGTVTGRLSSSDPNMQNIPAHGEMSERIRRAFVASPGTTFLACDYSQIQLRIAALLSGEKRMLEVFKKGQDIHRVTAAKVFDVEEKNVTPAMRRRAKTINFGILYGMGSRALASTIGVSQEEAQAFLDHYFAQFPTLFEYFETVKKQARKNGYTQTLFGRKRFLPDIHSSLPHIRSEAERMAVNAPIQGLEADIIKKAMNDIYDAIYADPILQKSTKIILQIHDELLFEVQKNALKHAQNIIPPILENAYRNDKVHFVVDVKVGPNWQDLE